MRAEALAEPHKKFYIKEGQIHSADRKLKRVFTTFVILFDLCVSILGSATAVPSHWAFKFLHRTGLSSDFFIKLLF